MKKILLRIQTRWSNNVSCHVGFMNPANYIMGQNGIVKYNIENHLTYFSYIIIIIKLEYVVH